MNRFFACSFFLMFLVASCGTYRYPDASGIRETEPQELNNYYTDTAQVFVYRVKLDAFKKHINGRLIVKTLTHNAHHITWVDDTDQSLFDVYISPNEYELQEATGDFNKRVMKKEMINILRTMTEQRHATSALMFMDKTRYYPVYVQDNCYYTLKDRQVEHILQVKGSKEYLTIGYGEWNTHAVPTAITIEHKKFPITMDLVLDGEQSSLFYPETKGESLP